MILNLLIALTILYVACNLLLRYAANPQIFPYTGSSYGPETFPLRITDSAGRRIAARYEPREGARFLLLYHHGNGEDIGHFDPRLVLYRKLGLAVLAYDYPGYGQSEGSASEAAVYQAAEAVHDWAVHEAGWAPEAIVHYGRSLGGGPALYLATTRAAPAGVIIECSFRSIFRVVTSLPMLVPDRFPNEDRIRKLPCPALILHGERDRIVPIRHGIALYNAAPEPKHHLWFAEAGHNDIVESDPQGYLRAIETFLKTLE